MTTSLFPHLFEPLKIGNVEVPNRIVSSGHDTVMVHDGHVTEQLIAYHEARAVGGAGLIVVQVAGVHETARYTSHVLMATDDSVIPGYARLVDVVHAHGAKVFGQIFHPGREITESSDGTRPIAWAPSAMPSERYETMPVPMRQSEIEEVLDGYASAAGRLQRAGADGVEIVASHGYLPAQFLNPLTNLRTDDYGGSFDGRMKFLVEAIRRVRAVTGPEFVVGVRISGDEKSHDGLTPNLAIDVCRAIDATKALDYVSVCAGSSSSLSGALHIAAPMSEPAAYVAPLSAAVRDVVSVPVIVAGRINQPQEAELILQRGQADLCAMTRAMICDPQMPTKALTGRHEDIRACIGCNQACMGHFQMGYPISCIQHPETGREREYGALQITRRPKRVMVVGGGPAGLKAASVAAERGHDVTLFESGRRLGGQVLLAERLPGRSEFGGAITNLEHEATRNGVRFRMGETVDLSSIREFAPEVLVIATGSRPYMPPLELLDDPTILQAADVVAGADVPSGHVLVADTQGEWTGLGVATELASRGHRVTLAVSGYGAGDRLQQYARTAMIRDALARKVVIVPNVRLIGVDEDTAYLQHTLSEEPILVEDVAATVLALGNVPVDELRFEDHGAAEVVAIGDCLAARTVEEAILDGLKATAHV